MSMVMVLEMIFLKGLSSRYVLIWLKIKVSSAYNRMIEFLVYRLILILNIKMLVEHNLHLLHRLLLVILIDA